MTRSSLPFASSLLSLSTLSAMVAVCAALASSGCSSTDDPGTGTTDKCKAAGTKYPTSGCGTEIGSVITNYSFTGRLKGKNSPAPATTVRMSDFYNPDGASRTETVLVINVSGLWCAYCKEEAKQLPALSAKYAGKVIFMTDMMQKLDSSPADQGDVDAWITTFNLDTAVVADPTFQLGAAFFNPSQMPLNLIIDLKTMKIVQKFTGENLPEVTAQLDALTAG